MLIQKLKPRIYRPIIRIQRIKYNGVLIELPTGYEETLLEISKTDSFFVHIYMKNKQFQQILEKERLISVDKVFGHVRKTKAFDKFYKELNKVMKE